MRAKLLAINLKNVSTGGVCESNKPVGAIVADTDPNIVKNELDYWVHINTEYSK